MSCVHILSTSNSPQAVRKIPGAFYRAEYVPEFVKHITYRIMTSTIPVAEIQEQRMATERPSAAVQGGHETGELDSDLYVLALNRSMPPLS